jgi:hypothetical protein
LPGFIEKLLGVEMKKPTGLAGAVGFSCFEGSLGVKGFGGLGGRVCCKQGRYFVGEPVNRIPGATKRYGRG